MYSFNTYYLLTISSIFETNINIYAKIRAKKLYNTVFPIRLFISVEYSANKMPGIPKIPLNISVKNVFNVTTTGIINTINNGTT